MDLLKYIRWIVNVNNTIATGQWNNDGFDSVSICWWQGTPNYKILQWKISMEKKLLCKLIVEIFLIEMSKSSAKYLFIVLCGVFFLIETRKLLIFMGEEKAVKNYSLLWIKNDRNKRNSMRSYRSGVRMSINIFDTVLKRNLLCFFFSSSMKNAQFSKSINNGKYA